MGPLRESLIACSHGAANLCQQAVWTWRELPVPVIAAVHGVAYAGGLQLALGADLRYAAPDAGFSVMETRWGLIPDMVGTHLMRQLARDDIIKELTYSSRVFSAQDALAYGLVTRLCDDPRAAAIATAREIAARSQAFIERCADTRTADQTYRRIASVSTAARPPQPTRGRCGESPAAGAPVSGLKGPNAGSLRQVQSGSAAGAALCPPSLTTSAPIMLRPASEHRKTPGPAISAFSP